MSKLFLEFQVPDKYDQSDFRDIISEITSQLNKLSEGRLSARYQAQASVPTTVVAHAVGDIVWDSNPTVIGSIAPGVAANYVRLGWVCVAPGTPGTLQEIRVAIGT